MNFLWRQYQTLELLPESAVMPVRSLYHWQRVGQLLQAFHHGPPQTPIIWTTLDPQQNLQWHVFDPNTGRTLLSMSEYAFQRWFRDRYFSA